MACGITIDRVIGNPLDLTVTVEGTATECEHIIIGLQCRGTSIESEPIAVDTETRRWEHTFPNTQCACGEPIVVEAWCELDERCRADPPYAADLQCPEPCPTARLEAEVGECHDGRRRVNFTVTITNETDGLVVAYVEYEPGVYSRPISVPNDGIMRTFPVHYDYSPPGPPIPRLIIDRPSGCDPVEPESPIGELEACCPTRDDVEVIIAEECNPDRTRDVTFDFGTTVRVTEARYGDGEIEHDFLGIRLSHTYLPLGPYTATFVIEGCDEIEKEVGPLDVCPCPCCGVQWRGRVPANSTVRWFTFNWPAYWHVIWTVVPTTPRPGGPQIRWKVQVERASGDYITYWISVTNLTSTAVGIEGRYCVLGIS